MNQLDWNQKRIKNIIDFCGAEFFHNKKILDLGSGTGEIAGVFFRLGADLTLVDARQDHLKLAAKKYPGVKVVKADLDQSWSFNQHQYDIILSLGILCHLADFEKHLKYICKHGNYIILETAVSDSQDEFSNTVVGENQSAANLAVNGVGSRPSAAAIERVLTQCGMSFKRLDSAKLNSGSYKYDWKVKNTYDNSLCNRRIWFINKVAVTTPKIESKHKIIVNQPVLGQVSSLADSGIPLGNFPIPVIKNQLKVAVCISGHLRTFEKCYPSFKEYLLDKYDCDVFIDTWSFLGAPHRSHDARVQQYNLNNFYNQINDLYQPKKFVIEPFKYFALTPLMNQKIIDHRDHGAILSMFYKIEQCNKLKIKYEQEQNFTYDCVIRFRSDIMLEGELPLNDKTDLSKVHFPHHGNFTGLNDQLAFSSSANMNIYSSLYSNLEKLLSAGAVLNPEQLVQFNVNYHQLPFIHTPVKYVLKRSNGTTQNNILLAHLLGMHK